MITGELKSKVDRVWDAFWSGGIANPLEVIEQITYLLFLRRLDEIQTRLERKAIRTGRASERLFFDGPDDPRRWQNFKNTDAAAIFATVSEEVFPFLRGLGGEQSTYSSHMKDARFTIPTAALLARVVDLLDGIPMKTATPTATCTSTCCPRSRRPARTANSARRGTSSR